MIRRPRRSPLFPYTTLFRSLFSHFERDEEEGVRAVLDVVHGRELLFAVAAPAARGHEDHPRGADRRHVLGVVAGAGEDAAVARPPPPRGPPAPRADGRGEGGPRPAPAGPGGGGGAFPPPPRADRAVHHP